MGRVQISILLFLAGALAASAFNECHHPLTHVPTKVVGKYRAIAVGWSYLQDNNEEKTKGFPLRPLSLPTPRSVFLERSFQLVVGGTAFGLVQQKQVAAAPQKLLFQTSDSGLQYADIEVGQGAEVVMGKRVNFHYIGRLAGWKTIP
mmetsp:Transcript_41439/g.68464  ORF Transcript_41439/g.68464 Transcript_41439/m.68464 type:complete len:147 (-) Transcript_41439:579-1019(-)